MNIFLTGGAGMLGSELQKIWGKRHKVVAPAHAHFRVEDWYAWERMIQNYPNTEVIFHAAAYIGVDKAEREKECCFSTNVTGTRNAVKAARILGCRLIYISSDYVFDGVKGNYSEDDFPRPLNFYGLTKLLGEEAALSLPDSAIVRTSHAKNAPWPHPRAWSDVYTSKDYVNVTALEVAKTVKIGFTGIVHIGTERKSVLDLARQKSPRIEGISRNEVASQFAIPADVSLDCSHWALTKRLWQQIAREEV